MSMSDSNRLREAFSAGTPVIALDGERLGVVRSVQSHYLLVALEGDPDTDLEVPAGAIEGTDGHQIQLSVNRRALSSVDSPEE